jgi:fatty acid desaturase
VYSLHEAAAHNAVFSGTGVLARAAQFLARNACRIGQGDPEYYAACHMGHHSKFGTKDDPEFLNFVLPHRLWMSLLPFAALINFTDFLAHRPMTYTRSRVITGIVGTTYHTIYGWLMFRAYGLLVPVVAFALVLNIALYFDRIRQFVEHNLMPLENRVGARSLGIGFWGLLIGGGYWGQPCHLAHHLVASVPWYQQIVLHRYIKGLLTPRQREQFLIRPVIGLPMLFWQIVRDANEFARLQSIGTHPPPHDH